MAAAYGRHEKPTMLVLRPRVLLVEDDRDLANMLRDLLMEDGYLVDIGRDGERGLELGLSRAYDLLVLDRGLPVIDGLDLLRRLRARGRDTPALILSARGLPHDRVDGLDAGASDYMSKPFDIDELLARLRALRRRHFVRPPMLPIAGGVFNVNARAVEPLDGAPPIDLSEKEAELLALLARLPSQVLTRKSLMESVFTGVDDPGIIDVYVHHLRRKLGRGVIRTARGTGYQLGRTPASPA